MNSILEDISKIGLMPVIKLYDIAKATNLANALTKGGIPIAEITFRAEGADKAISAIASRMPNMLVGAGTVINRNQAALAIDSGAKYIVCPGFVPEVVKYCIDKNICVIPGCTNASEISMAINFGLDVVKFFPAEAMGGIKVIKALSGPFPNIKFIPTGGIDTDNILEYLSFKNVIACGGSWMVPQKLLENNDWDGIITLASKAIKCVNSIKNKETV